jgi:hypothetical protein
MREIRPSGSEGGATQTNAPLLPLSLGMSEGAAWHADEVRVRGSAALARLWRAEAGAPFEGSRKARPGTRQEYRTIPCQPAGRSDTVGEDGPQAA